MKRCSILTNLYKYLYKDFIYTVYKSTYLLPFTPLACRAATKYLHPCLSVVLQYTKVVNFNLQKIESIVVGFGCCFLLAHLSWISDHPLSFLWLSIRLSINFSLFRPFSPQPLGQFQPNLAKIIFGWRENSIFLFIWRATPFSRGR